jgi:hypothetical protein
MKQNRCLALCVPWVFSVVAGWTATPCARGQAQITTSQYNNARTGENLSETMLTPKNVNSRTFGKLFSLPVNGDVYAQPLYLAGLEIPGKGKHNVLFVATEHDSVYAMDADKKAPPLWLVDFADAAKHVTPVPGREIRCPFINPEVGITSTPAMVTFLPLPEWRLQRG